MEQNQDLARALARLTVGWGGVQLRSPDVAAGLVADCIGGARDFAYTRAYAIGTQLSQAAGREALRKERSAYAATLTRKHAMPRIIRVQDEQTSPTIIETRRVEPREWNRIVRVLAGAKPQQVNPWPMLALEDAKRIVREWFGVEAEKETVAEDAHSRQRRRWEAAVAHCDRTQQAHPRFAITMGKRQFKTFRGIGDLASAEGVTRQAFTDDLRAYAERQSGR